MALSIALRSLSVLATAGLVGARTPTGADTTTSPNGPMPEHIGNFDLQVLAEGGCHGDVSGVYRFRGTSKYGQPFFMRMPERSEHDEHHDMDMMNETGEEDMFLFFFPCGGRPAPDGWYFGPMPPSDIPMEFCGDMSSLLHFPLPMPDALSLSTNMSNMWHSSDCDTDTEVNIEPLRIDFDDLVIFGFTCQKSLNGLWKLVPESRMLGRPSYYQESDEGVLVLTYRDDIPECEGLNQMWSIWKKEDLEDDHDDHHRCDALARPAWPAWPPSYDIQAIQGGWEERCEDYTWWSHVGVAARTRTPESSGCPERFAQFIGDELCWSWDSYSTCYFHCHRMLLVAEQVCTDIDMMWSWNYDGGDDNETYGEMIPVVDDLHAMWMKCEPNDDCYSMLSEMFSEEWHHCFDMVCHEEMTSGNDPWTIETPMDWECMDKYLRTIDACEFTEASIHVPEAPSDRVFELLQSKFWCYGGDHDDGECIMIPRETAHRINAVECMDMHDDDHYHDHYDI